MVFLRESDAQHTAFLEFSKATGELLKS